MFTDRDARRRTRFLAGLAALTLAGSLTAFVAPATAAEDPPTYGGFSIDGVVPDAGFTAYPDPSGNVDELGPKNGAPQQLSKIHTAPKPMLEYTNPNVQTDLANVWLETETTADGTWLYFAWERETDNGSGVIMFEFQKAAKPVACAYDTATDAQLIANCNPWQNRQAGDFIIVWDWSGSSKTIIKRTFVAGSGGSLSLDAGVPLSADDAKAEYSADKFRGEAAVNLSTTVFPPTPTSCLTIANVIPFTGTGNSDTADIKDTVLNNFAGTYISNCGSVEITKQTTPAGENGTFPVTATRSGGGDVKFGNVTSAGVTLDGDDDTKTIVDLLPGTDYRLTETVPAGWELLSITCDGGPDIKTTGTFAVVASEVTECAVSNKLAQPSIDVEKSASPTTGLSVGSTVTYTITVENTGNVPLTSVAVDDPKCASPPAYVSGDANSDNVLQEDETWTFTCTYSITQADVDAGSVTNEATGEAYYGDQKVDDKDTAVVYTLSTPAIEVVKTAAPDSGLVLGDEVLYSVTVENTGTVTLSGVVVDDPICELEYVSGDTNDDGLLQVDETWLYECSYTITQEDVDAGSVLNTATGEAFYGDDRVEDDDDATVDTFQDPSIDVTKSASPTSGLELDDPVLYTVTVHNDGNVTLSDVDVDDELCPAVYHSGDDGDGLLQVDETWTFTCTYSVTQADVDAGSVLNTAYGSAWFGDDEVTDEDSATVYTLQDPSIAVDKSADPSTGLVAGDEVLYTVTVDNDGNVTLSDVTVDDELCPAEYVSGDANDDGLLQVTETWVYECTYTVTQDDVDAGSVLNTAYGSAFFGDDEVTDDDSAVITMPQGAEITVHKSAEPSEALVLGDEVLYTVAVDNTGNVTLDDVTVDDAICTLEYVSGDTDDDGRLQVTETWVYECTYTITQDDVDAGAVMNTAYGSAFFGDDEVTDDDSAVVTTLQNPSIEVSKSASPSSDLELGDLVLYTVTVDNNGDVTLSDVAVDDPMCELAYLSGDANEDELLQVTETWTFTCTYAITQDDVEAGSVTNTAVGSAFFGEEEVTDQDSAEVTTLQNPSIDVVKSADPSSGLVLGDEVEYTVAVANDGNVTLSDVAVDDPICELEYVSGDVNEDELLQITETWVFTCTYVITQADVDAGEVSNTAVGSAFFGETEVTDEDEVVVTIPQNAALGLVKTADKASYSTLGEVITYTYVVTNTGNVTLAGPFTVNDDKTPVTCPATATLAVGASITCTASYSITEADLAADGVTNVARATNGTVVSPPATVTVEQVRVLPFVAEPTPTPTPTPAPAAAPRVLPFTGAFLLPLLVLGTAATLAGLVIAGAARRKQS
jgi:uncharacterized repeat protein (TIGR01451 family)